jgi:hypothetical protein
MGFSPEFYESDEVSLGRFQCMNLSLACIIQLFRRFAEGLT